MPAGRHRAAGRPPPAAAHRGATRRYARGSSSTRNPPNRTRIGQLPRVLAGAFGLLLHAAPGLTVSLVLLQIVNAVAQAMTTVLMGRLIAQVVAPVATTATGGLTGLIGELADQLAVLAMVLLVSTSALLIQSTLQLMLSERVTWHAFERILDVAVAAEPELFDHPEFHDRLGRAQNASTRPLVICNNLLSLVGSVSLVGSLSAVLFATSPPLVALLLISLFPILWANAAASRRAYRLSVSLSEHERRRAYIRGLLMGRESAVEVRAYRLSGYLRSLSERMFKHRYSRLRRIALRALPDQFAASMATVATLLVGIGAVAALARRGTISPAAASSAALVVLQLRGALGNVGTTLSQLYDGALFLNDFRAFRALLPRLRARRRAALRAPRDFSSIYVDNVSFAYPGSPTAAIRGVSMVLRRGQIIALVGENGSGKTTLAKLVCGLYSPQRGHIWWDDHDLSQMDSDEVRDSVAILMQNFGRYLFTVAENIGIGRVSQLHDREAIRIAATRARAHGFIRHLPNGYDTLLGKVFAGGTDLSGGQWQRIALARAFFRAAPLVVLDEPTASLDPRAEHELFEGMRELFVGRTVLLITHRLLSVRSADQIYVLDAGRVAEAGTHDDLMAVDGRYARMYRVQAANRRDLLRPEWSRHER